MSIKQVFLGFSLFACSPGGDSVPLPEGLSSVDIGLEQEAMLCRPVGKGPFPIALYNHGGLGEALGGPPEDTCLALSEEGYLAMSVLRRETVPIEGHSDDVDAGIAALKAQPDADGASFVLLGFSRGGFLTVESMTRHSEVTHAVIMAPAPVNGLLEAQLEDIGNTRAESLVLVAENDLPEFNNEGQDHVATAQAVHQTYQEAGLVSTLHILEAYEDNGHDLFQELRESYWDYVRSFLAL